MGFDLKRQLELELQVSSGVQVPLTNVPPDLRAYLARIQLNDGTLAGSICGLTTPHPLQSLKTEIFLGNLRRAQVILELGLESNRKDKEVYLEFLIEKARLCLYNADWANGISTTTALLTEDLPLVSKLTVLQMHAAALGEAGDIDKALYIISTIEPLEKLYPGGNVIFYAKNQRVKLIARKGDLDSAFKGFEELWQSYIVRNSALSLDFLLTLARTQMELRTLRQQNAQSWGWLAVRLCKMMGDRLFEALTLAELLRNHNASSINGVFESHLSIPSLVREFPRVAWYLGTQDTTAAVLANEPPALSASICIFRGRGLVADLSCRQRMTVGSDSVLVSAIEFLLRGSCSREDMFMHLYSIPYRQTKHSNGLRTLLSRLRKAFHVEIITQDERIELADARRIWLVD